MTIADLILNASTYEDTEGYTFQIYAKRVNGKFQAHSEAKLFQLTEKELEMKTHDYAETHCPGFEYFLELFILQEFIKDLKNLKEYKSDQAKIDRVIYYAEFDA